MEGEGSKKQSNSEMAGEPSSKRPKRMNDNSDTKASESVSSDSDSDCSSANGGTEPWDVPINSTTKHLLFMPVDPRSGNHLEKLNEFSQLKALTKLKSICIDLTHTIEESDEHDDDIADILNRILQASAGCLKEITLRTPIGQLPDVVFPIMKQVTKLELLFYWWGSDATNFTGCLRAGEIFPKGFKFSVLPQLEEVIIKLETEGGSPQYYTRFDCWKNNLKSCRIAKTVKRIQYNDDCGFSKQRLKITFPNAKWSEYSNMNTTCESSSEEEDDSDDDSDKDSDNDSNLFRFLFKSRNR